MVWVGMGAELVFEIFTKRGGARFGTAESNEKKYYIRILWSGRVLTSSNPSLGRVELLDLDTFLAYVDGLVGVNASKVVEFCEREE